MQVPKSTAGANSLKRIAATASSARVLDLHSLAVENPGDPDYLARPLFVHPVLNRSIIVKHNLQAGEGDRLPPGRFNATKVIFPFDQFDLNLGGQALFVDQEDLAGALTRRLDYHELPLERDLAVLQTMARLPTLDPFLLSEVLNRQRIDVGRCYFRFSARDRDEMLGFVTAEIEALIQACFGTTSTNDKRARRLSELLLSGQSSPELEPLRTTFRMDEAEFSEAIFAWKAFLYYRWRSHDLAVLLKSTLRSVASIDLKRYRRGELTFVAKAKPLLEATIVENWREVGRLLRLYDRAFASLTEQENPDGFQSFLANGASLFVELGERIGRLEQVNSFWEDRFGGGTEGMSPEDVLNGVRDLAQALAIQVGVRSTWGGADRRPTRA
jgi:hypothetical protein